MKAEGSVLNVPDSYIPAAASSTYGAQATQVPPLPAVLQARRAAGDEAPAEKK